MRMSTFHSPVGKVYSFRKRKESFYQKYKKSIIFTLLSLGILFLSIKGFCASTITYHAPAVSVEPGGSVIKPLFVTCVSSSGVRESCSGGSGGGTAYQADNLSLQLIGTTFSAKPSSVTLQGNAFNGVSQLVKLDSAGSLNLPGDYSAFMVDGSTLIAMQDADSDDSLVIGRGAGNINTGGGNTFIGQNSGLYSTTGTYNTYVGMDSGYYNATGNNNSAFGAWALASNYYGSENTCIGMLSCRVGLDISSNTLVGFESGFQMDGNGNTFLGWKTGYNSVTGNQNILIGYGLDLPYASTSYYISIGDLIKGSISESSVTVAGNLYANSYYGDGSNLIGLTAYTADEVSLHKSAGEVFSAFASSVTLQGNSFNGANQLIKLNGNGDVRINNNLLQLGTTDAFSRTQIWMQTPDSILRMGADTADGDSSDIDSEGIVIYKPTDLFAARVKADRFGLTSSTDTSYYYFRSDPDKFYYGNYLNNGRYILWVDRISEKVGIGTSSPSEALYVVGNSSITGIVTASTFNAVGTAYQYNGINIYDSTGFHGAGTDITGVTVAAADILAGSLGTDVLVSSIAVGAVQDSALVNDKVNVAGDYMTGQLTLLSSSLTATSASVGGNTLDGNFVSTGDVTGVYFHGDGSLIANLPAQGAQAFYFTTDGSDIATYYTMYSFATSVVSTITLSGITEADVVISTWVTLSNAIVPGLVPAGVWDIEVYANQTAGSKKVVLYGKFYKRSPAGALTLIGTSFNSASLTSTITEYRLSFSAPAVTLEPGDRLMAVGYYTVSGTGGNPDVNIYFGGKYDAYLDAPASAVNVFTFLPYTGATTLVNTGAYGVITSSDIVANKFHGDGSLLTGISAGDNLGSHIATTTLNMGGQTIVNVSSFTIITSTTMASELWVSTSSVLPHLYISTMGAIGINTTSPGSTLDIKANPAQNFLTRWMSASGSVYAQMAGTTGRFSIGGANPYEIFEIDAPDNGSGSAIAIRQNNASTYGYDFLMDTLTDGHLELSRVVNLVKTPVMYFDRATGYVGVGSASAPSSTFTVTGNVYVSLDVSALTFTDRTPYPKSKEEAYEAVNSIISDGHGGVEHSSLSPFIKSRYQEKIITGTEIKSSPYDSKQMVETPVYATFEREGRNLSATVSALVEVIKDLQIRIEKLEGSKSP